MIKANFKILIIISLMISICIPVFVYAIETLEDKEVITDEKFFYIDKLEASQGEEIVMTIDLSKIEYNNFEFILNSDIDLEQIISEEVTTEIENDEFKIVSNKQEINMDKISLYYKIPEDIQTGSTITLIGKIKEYINEKEEEIITETTLTNDGNIIDKEENINKETKNEIIDSEEKPAIDKNSEKEVTIIIKIVDKQESNTNSQGNEKNEQTTQDSANSEQTKPQQQTQVTQSSSSSKGGSTSSSTKTVTYKGDSNNYLKSLKIEGEDLIPTFSKTNTTYFVNVDEEIEELDITAKADDSTAKVRIYGEDNLAEGVNKVLISVTADNGDARTYRIYVTK